MNRSKIFQGVRVVVQPKTQFIVALLLSVFASFPVFAAPDFYSKSLSRVSTDEGLSNTSVFSIVEDNQGYLWFGTLTGLNRYDGYSVKSIKGPGNVFEKDTISTLYVDSKGFIWVGTNFSGLYRLDPVSFDAVQYFSGKFSQEDEYYSKIYALEQESEHVFWVAISTGVYRIDTASNTFSSVFNVKTNRDIVRALLWDNNQLFVGASNGLYVVNTATMESNVVTHKPESVTGIDTNNVKSLQLTSSNDLLVGTVEGLFFVPRTGTNFGKPESLVSKLNIWDIAPYEGQYFLGTSKGLYLLNTDSGENRFILRYQDSFYRTSDNNVFSIHLYKNESLWLASNANGVLRWNLSTTKFKRITSSEPFNLSNDNVWTLVQDDDDLLWIGTDNGLHSADLASPSDTRVYFYNEDIYARENIHKISALYKDSEDHNYLWLLNDRGLYRFNKRTGGLEDPFLKDKTKLSLFRDDWFFGVYVQDNDNIFFYTLSGHYHYSALTGEVTLLKGLLPLDPGLSYTFMGYIPHTRKMLLSTSGHVYAYNMDNDGLELVYKIDTYHPQQFSSVEDWVVDKNNTLWFGMSGDGVIGVDAQTFEKKYHFSAEDGLETNTFFAFMVDLNGDVWISSKSGLYKLNTDTLHFTRYTESDGLVSTAFNEYAKVKLNTGEMAFGSPQGVTIFDPIDFQVNAKVSDYQVHFTDISLMSSDMTPESVRSETVNLEHSDYGLRVSFSTLDYEHIQHTRYHVLFEGNSMSLEWSDYTENSILLPKLAPGDYVLEIIATHPHTGIVSPTAVKNITVAYAPWSSPTAKWIYLLAISLMFSAYILARNKRNWQLQTAQVKAEFNEKRMEMALDSSNSNVWEFDKKTGVMHQKVLCEELGHGINYCLNIDNHFALVRDSERRQLSARWQAFVEGQNDAWDEIYQLKSASNKWIWYRHVGKACEWDRQGMPTKFIGTYTNINESRVNEEQALIFGSAFSQINDWVLILDHDKVPVTVNDSFTEAFDLPDNTALSTLNDILSRLGNDKSEKFKQILESLKPRESWQGEDYVETAKVESHPVLIKITAVTNEAHYITHYVVVVSDITAQKEAEKKLHHIAHFDHLTNLANRKLFFESLSASIKSGVKEFALLFIDLDKFKQVNDLYSHRTGDQLLIRVAEILKTCIGNLGIVARQSGDEFLVQIHDYHSIDQVTHIADDIINHLNQPIWVNNYSVSISSSIGIAIYPSDSSHAEDLIQKADLAMIHAKNLGRDQFQFYTHEMNEKAHKRLTLESKLRTACEKDSFTNFYQPIVNVMSTPKVVGCELLLRWFDGDDVIPPFQFIPIAEEIGLIQTMTMNAVERALLDYQHYFSTIEGFYISINLSPVLLIQGSLVRNLLRVLKQFDLPSSVLRLEITESALLSDLNIALEQLQKLKESGFELMLDDFGTGYSSMTYLSRFPVQKIKIDKSFILNIQDKANYTIVQSITYLASNMDLTCVAEGVESEEQLALVKDLGCDLIQGYYFGKPMPAEKLIALILSMKKNML